MCFDNHRRRPWRRPELHADPAFTIARHRSPQLGVMGMLMTLRSDWSKFCQKYHRRPSGCFITLRPVVWQLASRTEMGLHLIELVTF
ncbi:hypothetical protein TNCV_1426031 [Trichonephila clavipes]|nr:hypothetical protein TNCV_1426031 [Trichonephila clavipes]